MKFSIFVMLTLSTYSVVCWPKRLSINLEGLPFKLLKEDAVSALISKYSQDLDKIDADKYLLKNGTTIPSSAGENNQYLTACIFKCHKLVELNTVCATDYRTYFNVGQILCSRKCGIDLRVLHLSECTEDSKKEQGPLSEDQRKLCMAECPSDVKYDPVCGTDNITYDNRDKLGCAQVCGVDVYLAKPSSCSENSIQEAKI